jgi:hypothetical protein
MIQLLWLLLVLMVCCGANGQRWIQLYDDINGENSGDNAGRDVAISGDGTTVAIGAPNNSAKGSNSGHVRVFRNTGSVWLQLGDDIDGDAFDYSVMSTSLIQHHWTHTYPSYINRDGRYRCRITAILWQLARSEPTPMPVVCVCINSMVMHGCRSAMTSTATLPVSIR